MVTTKSGVPLFIFKHLVILNLLSFVCYYDKMADNVSLNFMALPVSTYCIPKVTPQNIWENTVAVAEIQHI